MAGYSGTPLAKKLGFKGPMKVLALHAPAEYESWLAPLPDEVRIVSRATPPVAAAHVFVDDRTVLARALQRFRSELQQDGFVWISWPKKSSGVATNVTEDAIRELALPLGLVDVKVCAVSDVWSGLKLVIRKEQRKA